jgi:hypothetical protein
MSCVTFALRLPPRECCLPRGYLLVRRERRMWRRHHPVTGHCRTLMGRRTGIGHTVRTVRHQLMCRRRTLMVRHAVMGHCRTPIDHGPAMAQTPSTVCHRALMIHRSTQCRTTQPLASKPGTKSSIASRKPCYKSGWHRRMITLSLLHDPQLVRAEFLACVPCALATSTTAARL